MRFRLIIGLIIFILLEGGLIVYAVRVVDRIKTRLEISAVKWKLYMVLGILGMSILAGLFSTGIFLIFEVGIAWILVPMFLAGWIVYLLIRRNLLKKESRG